MISDQATRTVHLPALSPLTALHKLALHVVRPVELASCYVLLAAWVLVGAVVGRRCGWISCCCCCCCCCCCFTGTPGGGKVRFVENRISNDRITNKKLKPLNTTYLFHILACKLLGFFSTSSRLRRSGAGTMHLART